MGNGEGWVYSCAFVLSVLHLCNRKSWARSVEPLLTLLLLRLFIDLPHALRHQSPSARP